MAKTETWNDIFLRYMQIPMEKRPDLTAWLRTNYNVPTPKTNS